MSEKPKGVVKNAVLHFCAGATAGFTEVCIMHPLDVVKTRMQIQSAKSSRPATQGAQVYYDGVFDTFRKMYRHEGFFSVYKGIIPPILAETPKRAVKFLTFEAYQKMFMFGAPAPTPVTFSLAGACAGITEAILVNPFEVVKVTMQSNRSTSKDYTTWSVAKNIVKTGGWGLNGLNKGLSGTIARNGVFNMVYFGFYHSVKGYLPKANDHYGEILGKLLIGFTSGTLASCLNIPFDVAKSRIQGPQPVPGQIKYKGLFSSLRLIYVEEGWKALYKGLAPKVMRLGPGGAIMLVVNEYAYEFLVKMFPD